MINQIPGCNCTPQSYTERYGVLWDDLHIPTSHGRCSSSTSPQVWRQIEGLITLHLSQRSLKHPSQKSLQSHNHHRNLNNSTSRIRLTMDNWCSQSFKESICDLEITLGKTNEVVERVFILPKSPPNLFPCPVLSLIFDFTPLQTPIGHLTALRLKS